MTVSVDGCEEKGIGIRKDRCFNIQHTCRMGCDITSLHFPLFQNLGSCIRSICCGRELHLFPKETASIQIQIIITVFYGELTVKLLVDRSIHDLYRTP